METIALIVGTIILYLIIFRPKPATNKPSISVEVRQSEEEIEEKYSPFYIYHPDTFSQDHDYEITYIDSEGKITKRRITTINVYPKDEFEDYLESYCHKQKDSRTFVSSRISKAVDLQTGEILPTKKLYAKW